MPGRFQSYETRLPKLHAWHLQELQDLEDALQSCNAQLETKSFSFAKWSPWGSGSYTRVESALVLKDEQLVFETYRNSYGGVDSVTVRVASVGDLLVLNFDKGLGIFLSDFETPLTAEQLPPEMTQATMVLITSETGESVGPPF